ncbi:MAG: septal ring lytic transglycosylase RlpA family protein [Hyphomicrobiaceae bacterium]|nr:septal ring lytic transglycosylase RlpA family protein [Hyphomicrobiaceae bacterium]
MTSIHDRSLPRERQANLAASSAVAQRFSRVAARVSASVLTAAVVSGCANSERQTPTRWSTDVTAAAPRTKFAPSAYGVDASPRIASPRTRIGRGGGTYKVGKPYKIAGRWYVPREEPNYDRSGSASWYGDNFHGRLTANGETFDKYALTAAHPTLPLPSYVYVTNEENGRTVLVRVNDRGPYVHGRLIDLSHAVAHHLGFEHKGVAKVRVRYAGRAPLNGDHARELQYLARQPWYRGRAIAPFASRSSNRMLLGLF